VRLAKSNANVPENLLAEVKDLEIRIGIVERQLATEAGRLLDVSPEAADAVAQAGAAFLIEAYQWPHLWGFGWA